jgi:hypothetical protein
MLGGSIEEVIARVIRNTRVQDNSYIKDMDEWIPEAMGLLKTQFQLISKYEDIVINFHKGKLPRDLDYIDAVEINGKRLHKGNSIIAPGSNSREQNKRLHGGLNGTTNGFEFLPQVYNAPSQPNPQENSQIFTQDLVPQGPRRHEEDHWYSEDINGYINTSLHTGRIRVHYKAIPCDEDGLPIIPNNENYKQALYFYCRAMMIGAGYKDNVFTYDKIMDVNPKGHFWTYGERAIGEIIYPDLNSMEYKMNANLRLIKDESYFDKFFNTPHEERKYGYEDYMDNRSPVGNVNTFLNGPTT